MSDLEIRKLSHSDIDYFIELIQVFDDVFEREDRSLPGKDHLQNLLAKDNFLIFAALVNNTIVGGLTAYILQQYYSALPLVYIYDVAVKTRFQRQGIGKLLMSNIIDYCKKNGMEEVFVQADFEDSYAIDFYHSTGATSQQTVHFSYFLTNKKVNKTDFPL